MTEINTGALPVANAAAPITRRDAIASLGAAAGALICSRGLQAAEPAADQKIDCHVHFYDTARPEGVPWPGKGDPQMYRPRMPQDFLALARPHGITRCIVIEASTWPRDNAWLLDLAAKEPCIAGVVGHVEPGEEVFAEQIAALAKNRTFRGIRVGMPHVQKALTDATVFGRLASLADYNLTLDVNGAPSVLEPLAALAPLVPKLRIVLNHMANPKIDGGPPPQDWQEGIRKLAAFGNVYCKWSAFAEHAPQRPATTDVEFYRPLFDHVWGQFGAQRMLFGSNWPVSDKAADYASIVKVADAYLASRSPQDRQQCYQTNTIQAYGIA